MRQERARAELDPMGRSMPFPPLAKPISHGTAAGVVQHHRQHHHNHSNSLPPRPKPRHPDTALTAVVQDRRCTSLPPFAKPRPDYATLRAAQDRRLLGSAVRDAARVARGGPTSAALPDTVGSQRTPDWWKRHTPQQPLLPPLHPPLPTPRCGNLEALLAVLLMVFLLFSPLLLPELPPPPVALLLILLAVMAASLLVLVFLPSDFRAAASSYV